MGRYLTSLFQSCLEEASMSQSTPAMHTSQVTHAVVDHIKRITFYRFADIIIIMDCIKCCGNTGCSELNLNSNSNE